MKRKYMPILLALCLLMTALLPACSAPDGETSAPPSSGVEAEATEKPASDGEPIRVLVEMDNIALDISASLESMIFWMGQYGGPEDVELEILSGDPTERAAALTHLKTEILSGGGPDVFLCVCDWWSISDVLFHYPQQAMKRNIFLPLDEYIANARYMEWDKQFPLVMEAGRNDQGQMVLPLTWTLPTTLFRQSEVEFDHSKAMTYGEMVGGGDPVLEQAACLSLTGHIRGTCISNIFDELADFSKDEPAFTEEELRTVLDGQRTLHQKDEAGGFEDGPDCYQTMLRVSYTKSPNEEVYYSDEHKANYFRNMDPAEITTMVPLYTLGGECVANITSFAAINVNCKRPEDAFYFLDLLMSKEYQQSSVYKDLCYRLGLPTHMDLLQDSDRGPLKWYMPKENYEEFIKLRDSITQARMSCKIDSYLQELLWDALQADENLLEKEIQEAYMKIKMDLAES